MKKPLAVIIGGKGKDRNEMRRIIGSHRLGFSVEDFDSYGGWEDYRIKNQATPQLCFLGYHIKYGVNGSNGNLVDKVEIAKKIYETYPLTSITIMTGPEESPTTREAIIQAPFLNGPLETSNSPEIVKSWIDRLQREKQLAQELKVGVFGLGKLGRSVLYQIQDQRWIKEVHAYSSLETFPHVIESKYGRDFLKELREQYSQEGQDSDSWKHGMVKALNEMPDFGKTTFHKRLETLVEDDLDVLVITAGEHLEDLTQYPERKQLLQGSLKKIKPLFSALAKKYEKNQEKIPLLVIESNPPEDLLSIGKYEYCYPPHKMTSLGADSCRYKTALLDQLRGVIQGDKIVEVSIKPEELIEYREFIGGLNLEDVELDVVGEHGNAFPLLSHCRLRGKKLEEIEPSFSKPELAYILRKDQAETGKKAMIAAGVFESDYKKTPAKVGEGLSDLAHFQERPRSSWICHLDEENAFLMWPTRIDFSNLSVHTNSDINVKNLDPEIREEIENQINIQNRIS